MKKVVRATVVGYIVLMAMNYLIHGILLMPDYNAIPASHRTPEGIQQHFWAMALGQFLFAALFAYIYTRGAEKKPWPAQGIRYGIIMTLFTVIPYSISEYVVFVIPYALAIKWVVLGAIQLIILGLVVAATLKDAAPAT